MCALFSPNVPRSIIHSLSRALSLSFAADTRRTRTGPLPLQLFGPRNGRAACSSPMCKRCTASEWRARGCVRARASRQRPTASRRVRTLVPERAFGSARKVAMVGAGSNEVRLRCVCMFFLLSEVLPGVVSWLLVPFCCFSLSFGVLSVCARCRCRCRRRHRRRRRRFISFSELF